MASLLDHSDVSKFPGLVLARLVVFLGFIGWLRVGLFVWISRDTLPNTENLVAFKMAEVTIQIFGLSRVFGQLGLGLRPHHLLWETAWLFTLLDNAHHTFWVLAQRRFPTLFDQICALPKILFDKLHRSLGLMLLGDNRLLRNALGRDFVQRAVPFLVVLIFGLNLFPYLLQSSHNS